MKKKTTKSFNVQDYLTAAVALLNVGTILFIYWWYVGSRESTLPEGGTQQKEESKPRHLSKINGYSIVCLEGVSYWQGGHLNGVPVSLTPRYNRQGKIVWCEIPGEKL